jgi:hypothetical protein
LNNIITWKVLCPGKARGEGNKSVTLWLSLKTGQVIAGEPAPFADYLKNEIFAMAVA